MGKLDRFDDFVPVEPSVNPWQPHGSFQVDLDLLSQLLGVPVGTSQQSGVVAGAVDVWAAEGLRRAGMHPDEVWPRGTEPRVMPRDVRNFIDHGLTKKLRTDVRARYTSSGARKALPTEAKVMGSAYSKQADVVVASWAAGLELMISTKTMLSNCAKNLRNRFKEAYGDAKNLRGRHPLAALGFLFVIGADAKDSKVDFAIDMMDKLTSEPDVYDTACLIVADASTEVPDDEEEVRDEYDEPSALTNLDENDDDSAEEDASTQDATGDPTCTPVAVDLARIPARLGLDQFFEALIDKALLHMPAAVYPEVRNRRSGHGKRLGQDEHDLTDRKTAAIRRYSSENRTLCRYTRMPGNLAMFLHEVVDHSSPALDA